MNIFYQNNDSVTEARCEACNEVLKPGFQPCRLIYHNSTTGKEEIRHLCRRCALKSQNHYEKFYEIDYVQDDTYGMVKVLHLFDNEEDIIKYIKENVINNKEYEYYFEKDVCSKNSYIIYERKLMSHIHPNYEIGYTNLNLPKYEAELFK